jgi:L-galactose dehydrogenase
MLSVSFNAETNLGIALAASGAPRDSFVLATKVGRITETHFDFSANAVLASVEASMQRLGVSKVDIVQAHDVEFGSIDEIVRCVCALYYEVR